MPLRVTFGARLRSLREAFRRDPADPPRRWLRRNWRVAFGLGALLAGTAVFDAWLFTCGFGGCPTPGAIRAYQPPEGGRVLDRSGQLLGRLRLVKRVNVPLARVPDFPEHW